MKNNVSPELLSHPANCKLILHSENLKKNSKCNMTIDELIVKIEEFNRKYKLEG